MKNHLRYHNLANEKISCIHQQLLCKRQNHAFTNNLANDFFFFCQIQIQMKKNWQMKKEEALTNNNFSNEKSCAISQFHK
jgi:hypothetical protein